MRKLINGTTVPELDRPVKLEVYTKCPNKYKLVDMETGEEYIGQIPTNFIDDRPARKSMHWRKVNA